ncbi:hypothetical protein FOCC_FOCC013702 [Frankliniella occidentalis]|nr:hypothetical protein FOCC_FOCC013702 [Frankliniella occidentalis]
MPQAVHKILFHGADIIAASALAPGKLSDEAQESRNEDVRKFRDAFTRKCNSVATNSDLLKKLLVTSDHVISSFSVPRTKRLSLVRK